MMIRNTQMRQESANRLLCVLEQFLRRHASKVGHFLLRQKLTQVANLNAKMSNKLLDLKNIINTHKTQQQTASNDILITSGLITVLSTFWLGSGHQCGWSLGMQPVKRICFNISTQTLEIYSTGTVQCRTCNQQINGSTPSWAPSWANYSHLCHQAL